MTPRTRHILKLGALVALLIAGGYLAWRARMSGLLTRHGAQQLVTALRALWWAPVAFVGAYTVAAALDFSGFVLTLAGGAVFGFWWGSALNLIGANLGASAAFWIARLLGREGVRTILGRHSAGLDQLVQEAGFAWLLRLRLIPFVPFNLLNFASGLTAMPWRAYAGATALGLIPATLVYTFFADAILYSREAGHRTFQRVVVAGVLLVCLSFVPTIARKLGLLVPPSERPAGPS